MGYFIRLFLQLINVQEDGFLSLMAESGDVREDLKLPEGELGQKIKEEFDTGKELLVGVYDFQWRTLHKKIFISFFGNFRQHPIPADRSIDWLIDWFLHDTIAWSIDRLIDWLSEFAYTYFSFLFVTWMFLMFICSFLLNNAHAFFFLAVYRFGGRRWGVCDCLEAKCRRGQISNNVNFFAPSLLWYGLLVTTVFFVVDGVVHSGLSHQCFSFVFFLNLSWVLTKKCPIPKWRFLFARVFSRWIWPYATGRCWVIFPRTSFDTRVDVWMKSVGGREWSFRIWPWSFCGSAGKTLVDFDQQQKHLTNSQQLF